MRNGDATICLVDDDTSVRESLAAVVTAAGYRARTFAAAQDFLAALPDISRPAVLLSDVSMPGMDGFDLQEQIARQCANFPVILMTAYGTIPMAVKAMRGGAVDFLEKPFSSHDLLEALERAVERSAGGPGAELFAALSPREREVLNYMVKGEPNKVIARHLGISNRTVEVHRSRILHKTGARNLADLIHMAAGRNPARDAAKD